MVTNLGYELELLVLDESFNETNNADLVISEAKKQGVSITGECSHSMVEVCSIPGTIDVAAKDLVNQLVRLNNVADNLGLKVLPIEMPLNHDFKPKTRDSPRYEAKKNLLGEDRFEISGKVMGFHIHYDLPNDDEKKMEQINFLKLVDPLVISASASSPFEYGGVDYHSWRTHSYRYIVHEELPFQGQLQDFDTSYEQYVNEHLENYISFLEMSKKRNIDFSKYADEYNSIWGPTRINPTYNTSEIRSIGSTPDLRLLFGISALIQQGIDRIVSDSESNNIYLEILSEMRNPNEKYNFIQALSDDAMKYGFDSATVKNYCKSLIDFCVNSDYVDSSLPFLRYSKERINLGFSFSDIIANSNTSNQDVYKKLHNTYLNSIEKSKEILENE